MKTRKEYGLDRVTVIVNKSADGFKVTVSPWPDSKIVDLVQNLISDGEVERSEEKSTTGIIAEATVTEDGSFNNRGFLRDGCQDLRTHMQVLNQRIVALVDTSLRFEQVDHVAEHVAGKMLRLGIDHTTKKYTSTCEHCSRKADTSPMALFDIGGLTAVMMSDPTCCNPDVTKETITIPGADCLLPGDFQADYNEAASKRFQETLTAQMREQLPGLEETVRALSTSLEKTRDRLFPEEKGTGNKRRSEETARGRASV